VKLLFSLSIFIFASFFLPAQEDTIAKIRVKSPCKCIVAPDTAVGLCNIKVELKFEKNLKASDLECFGFKLLKENVPIACLRNTDSVDWEFKNIPAGQYNIEFFADGYYWKNNGIVVRKSDVSKTDYFLISRKQLPEYLQALIKERRKRKGRISR
jgi:hypothetical protein